MPAHVLQIPRLRLRVQQKDFPGKLLALRQVMRLSQMASRDRTGGRSAYKQGIRMALSVLKGGLHLKTQNPTVSHICDRISLPNTKKNSTQRSPHPQEVQGQSPITHSSPPCDALSIRSARWKFLLSVRDAHLYRTFTKKDNTARHVGRIPQIGCQIL